MSRPPLDPGESAQIGALLLDVKLIGLAFGTLVLLGCVALWGHVPSGYLVAWVALFAAEAALRFHVSSRYAKASAERRRDPIWRTFVRGVNVYTGIVYGLTALVLLVPLPKENFVLLACVFAGVYCLVCALSNYYAAVIWLSGVSMLLPLITALLLTGRPLYALSACLIGFMGALLARMALRTTRALSAEMASAAEHERLREVAERAVVEKSRFVAAISHDLRQPLHAMGLYQALLRERCRADAESLRLADRVGECIGTLVHQFGGLLEVSRLDADAVRPDLAHADASSLVERLRERFAAKAEAKGLALATESAPRAAVFTDPLLLERILSNLVSNAIDSTARGGVTVRVGPGERDTVAIDVIDTGIGIPAGELDRIFDEYYRLSENGAEGFGLGLAIVSRLCALLDVEIDVESRPGSGTRFRLRVPAGRVPEPAPGKAPPLATDVAGLAALVVDDDADVLDGMRRTLEGWGCTVRTARSAHEATERLAGDAFVPDVLLCDYRLGPGPNGVALAGRLRARSRADLPVVVVTGDSSRERLAEIAASGYALLHKPVAPAALREAIASAARTDAPGRRPVPAASR